MLIDFSKYRVCKNCDNIYIDKMLFEQKSELCKRCNKNIIDIDKIDNFLKKRFK